MIRLPDWRSRLHARLAENADRAFEPGVHDCSLFSADMVEAMTGDDPAAAYRGQYSTVAEGKALLRADGFSDHVAFAESLYTEVPVLQAQVGDLAVIRQFSQIGLGVVIGHSIAVAAESGIGHIPLSYAKRIFRV